MHKGNGEKFNPRDLSWQEDSLCAQIGDVSLFYLENGDSPETAKRVCMGCIAIDQCLKYALNNHEAYGVWGGKTSQERKAITELPEEKVAQATQEENSHKKSIEVNQAQAEQINLALDKFYSSQPNSTQHSQVAKPVSNRQKNQLVAGAIESLLDNFYQNTKN